MQLSKLINVANDAAPKLAGNPSPTWNLAELAGRLVEISASGPRAALSFSASLIWEAQHAGGHCIWLARKDSIFYPPDFASRGIDLSALPVVQAPTLGARLQALERALRSGAFSLILLDHQCHEKFPLHAQGRFVGLAKRHQTAVVAISEREREQGTMGSMVSLHVEARREDEGEGRFRCTLSAVKDKSRGPHWNISESMHAPLGLY